MRITSGTGMATSCARKAFSAASRTSAFSLSSSTTARRIETMLNGSYVALRTRTDDTLFYPPCSKTPRACENKTPGNKFRAHEKRVGVTNGARTHNLLGHNQVLRRLSYGHHNFVIYTVATHSDRGTRLAAVLDGPDNSLLAALLYAADGFRQELFATNADSRGLHIHERRDGQTCKTFKHRNNEPWKHHQQLTPLVLPKVPIPNE